MLLFCVLMAVLLTWSALDAALALAEDGGARVGVSGRGGTRRGDASAWVGVVVGGLGAVLTAFGALVSGASLRADVRRRRDGARES